MSVLQKPELTRSAQASSKTFEESTVQAVAGLGMLQLLVESQLLIVSFLVGLFSGDSVTL